MTEMTEEGKNEVVDSLFNRVDGKSTYKAILDDELEKEIESVNVSGNVATIIFKEPITVEANVGVESVDKMFSDNGLEVRLDEFKIGVY